MNAYRDQLLTVEDPNPLDSVHKKGPGPLLKGKREEMGLSHEQIAQTTKIRPHILQALEEEDWDSLPSSAFVKGFLRSYARALGLNEDVVANAYREVGEEKESQTEIETKTGAQEEGKSPVYPLGAPPPGRSFLPVYAWRTDLEPSLGESWKCPHKGRLPCTIGEDR